jgi:hypothetical protein
MTSRHHVSKLVAINGTKLRPKLRSKSQPKLRPESGPSRDHVGTKSGPSRDQVISKSPTQLATQSHKIASPNYCIKSVTDQVSEQVTSTNHREHRGHRYLAAEVKSTAKVTDRVTAKVTTYQGASKT